MPRDAIRETRVVTSTYDVAKGQFSGGEVASSTKSGTNALQTSLTYDSQSSALQIGAAPSAAFSRQYSLNRVSGSVGGPFVKNRLFGFGAVEASRKVNPIATLLVSDSTTNARLGIANDTAARCEAEHDLYGRCGSGKYGFSNRAFVGLFDIPDRG